MAAIASSLIPDFETLRAKWEQTVGVYNPVKDRVENLPLSEALSNISTSGECLIKLLNARVGVYSPDTPHLATAMEEASAFAVKIRTFRELDLALSKVYALYSATNEQMDGLPGLSDLIWLKERVEEKAQPAIESAHHQIQGLKGRVHQLEKGAAALRDLLPRLDEAWSAFTGQFLKPESGFLSYMSWSQIDSKGGVLLSGDRNIQVVSNRVAELHRLLITAKKPEEIGAYLRKLTDEFSKLSLDLDPVND